MIKYPTNYRPVHRAYGFQIKNTPNKQPGDRKASDLPPIICEQKIKQKNGHRRPIKYILRVYPEQGMADKLSQDPKSIINQAHAYPPENGHKKQIKLALNLRTHRLTEQTSKTLFRIFGKLLTI